MEYMIPDLSCSPGDPIFVDTEDVCWVFVPKLVLKCILDSCTSVKMLKKNNTMYVYMFSVIERKILGLKVEECGVEIDSAKFEQSRNRICVQP